MEQLLEEMKKAVELTKSEITAIEAALAPVITSRQPAPTDGVVGHPKSPGASPLRAVLEDIQEDIVSIAAQLRNIKDRIDL